MTIDELEQDIIRRVFDESFLNEKLMTKLLHAYRDAAIASERERCAQVCDEITDKRAAEMGLMHCEHLTGRLCAAAIRQL